MKSPVTTKDSLHKGPESGGHARVDNRSGQDEIAPASGKSSTAGAQLHMASRQRSVTYDHRELCLLVAAALPHCLTAAQALGGPLCHLDHIEFTLVGNRAMARIHRDFLEIRGTTDVITFPYGEIIVCAAVARLRAAEFGHDVTTEIALYCIHGLLHLAGYDDQNPDDAKLMAREQDRILRLAKSKVARQIKVRRVG
ncbi:MAG: rRNA maturation RNase YbeY [Terrimicrobiaceae bacterium]